MLSRIFLLAACLAAPALAAADPEMAKCAAVASGPERLDCYDQLAKARGLAGPAVTSSRSGKWHVSERRSPIDDSLNVYLNLIGERDLVGRWKERRPILWLRCKENKTELYVSTGMTAAGDETNVTIRLDKERAERTKWSNSTDGEAVFYPGNDIAFAQRLAKHQTLLFEIEPFNSSPTMTTFDIAGLAEALKPLRKACGW